MVAANKGDTMKHTPGPWEVTGNKKLFIEPINQRVNFTELYESCQHCNVNKNKDITNGSQIYNPRKLKEAQANARLMAAAPDLLEACKYAFENLKPKGNVKKDFGGHLAMATLSRAIKKAEV